MDRFAVDVELSDANRPGATGSAGIVMMTEYTARVGETVVVGASKFKGDDSLVLLVTLLPFEKPSGR